MKKEFEELNMIDNFLMNEIANDEEIGEDACRELVSSLLQRKIGKVRIISQKNIPPGRPDQRGIILDVEMEENIDIKEDSLPDINVYDVEPHRKPKNKENLPKRTRFYQAKIDARRLKSGERDFGKLPNLYIIFILDYDPFGHDRVCYTFDNACVELPELKYDDGLEIIYFNTNGTIGGNESVKNMLHFIENSTREYAVDDATRKMYDYVRQVKEQEVSKMRFVTYEEYFADDIEEAKEEARKKGLEDGRKEGHEEGRKEGHEEGRKEGHEEGRKEGREEGRKEGREEGRKEGDIRRIIKQICKKLAKGKTLDEIAEDIEEDVDVIRPLYDVVLSLPEYDEDKAFEAYIKSM